MLYLFPPSFSFSKCFQSRNFLLEALLPYSAYSALVTARLENSGVVTKADAAIYASVMGLSLEIISFTGT